MDSSIAHIVFFVMSLLLVALLAEPLAYRIRLPITAVLVILGFIGSQVILAVGYDVGLQSGQFHDLVFFVFLPVLIFESAFSIDGKLFFKNLAPSAVEGVCTSDF